MSRSKTTLRVALLLLTLVLLCVTLRGARSQSDVCLTCGAESHHISLFGIILSRRVKPTPLSALLANCGIVGPHDHNWTPDEIYGLPPFAPECIVRNGHGVVSEARNSLNTEFLELLITHDGTAAALPYVRCFLDPATVGQWRQTLRTTDFYDIDTRDPKAIEKWWTAHRAEVEKAIVR
jgi:hypothetical protein